MPADDRLPARPAPEPASPEVAAIVAALAGLRFGTLEIVVHEGRVAELRRTERVRLVTPAEEPPRRR